MVEKPHATTTPVFRLKAENRSNSAKIKHVGYLSENEKLGDEVIELDKPIHPKGDVVGKHAIPIKSIGAYEMVGRLFRCNIVGSHIVFSSRYPLMYLNIGYERPLVTGSLFQIFYSIDMNEEEKKAIKEKTKNEKDNKHYVGLKFTGTWHRHIDCDEEFVEHYETMITTMLKNEAKENYETLVSGELESLESYTEKYTERERIYYDSLMKDQEIPFRSFNKMRDHFVDLCTSTSSQGRFYKFIELAMKCREIHRRKQYGLPEQEESDNEFVVPKTVTKLDDVYQSLIENNELSLMDE